MLWVKVSDLVVKWFNFIMVMGNNVYVGFKGNVGIWRPI